MIYHHLFNRIDPHKVVRAGVIGTGHFATAVVTQAQAVTRLSVPVVAELDVSAARRAYQLAGVPDEAIIICESRGAALHALELGQRVILPDALLMMELPLDVIVEATGVPEAGARHALAAIEHGKHVVMVNKEADTIVGPILAHLAERASVVYTPADGDQHGLLMGMVAWAQELGLEVICAGKARDGEYIYDPARRTVQGGRETVTLSAENDRWLQPLIPGQAAETVAMRRHLLATLPQVAGYDLVELAIAANATGLLPDVETTHGPALYISELPEVFCPSDEGGILQRRGVIDCVICLRQPHEAGLGGGVFLVVACANDYSRHILHTKGLIANQRGTAAVIYRPYHLCGVETPLSILCAGLLGVSTGVTAPRPVLDVVARTHTAMQAGDSVGNDHSPTLQFLLRQTKPLASDIPLPLHMANGNRLAADLPAGTVITAGMVEEPQGSMLWALRRRQDEHFFQ